VIPKHTPVRLPFAGGRAGVWAAIFSTSEPENSAEVYADIGHVSAAAANF